MTEGPVRRSTRTRPRVLHLTTVDSSLAKLLLPQLIAFQHAGYEVIGVSAHGPYVEEIASHGIRHIAMQHATRAHDPRADLAAAREFVRICRRLRPDIVHTHNPKPGVYGRLGARWAGVPAVVNTVHGLYAQPTDRLARRAAVYALERLAGSCSDVELIQNPEDVPVLRKVGMPARKLRYLGNGVDLSAFDPKRYLNARSQVRAELGIGDDQFVVGLFGRLVWEKGYREVFEAARALRVHQPRIQFVIVGPRDLDKADAIPQAELNRVSQQASVRFLGMRDDVARLYLAMDLYVLASYREGFPRSAMEAAAMGLPIVATDIRGCRQVVDHGQTGLLVPVRDSIALRRTIESLADDPSRRQRMGAAGRHKAIREFDDRRQITMTLAVYAGLLASR